MYSFIPRAAPIHRDVTVQTSNGCQYRVKSELANQMVAIRCLLAKSADISVIPLEDIDSETFELVLKWCRTVRDSKVTLNEHSARTMFKKLVQESIDDRIMIYKLILAANFLDIESLWGATTQHLSDEINECKSVQDMNKIFNVK
ncbi:uncharacterized protein Dwil_GK22408 [Drosophila willistoni]|uniref:SKP1 component POZ domain-containing protein n=1 Tax=Drosophila willistoni TaxID=7260 RepID=B4NG64_DROWI|nr:SKP1-like protein 15 [Drosophila willistoni]EDW83281.1 uncharacterized protein Dwil_GK22408 [Drosophila willistoni]